MAHVVENPNGRRIIRLSVDDVLTVVAMYQQRCNCRNFTYDEIRRELKKQDIYLPEDIYTKMS